MESLKQIQKMNRETCNKELEKASRLTGKETEEDLNIILGKCLDIQGIILLNGFLSQK